ncbi:3-methyl-2-oxobutanoate hydroxymethyltransferase [Pelagibius sp. Alg239-R121]|uniref:3-methyl-2-oxobutanoate hydroxymethyltransferase n=1 Tax=Pelagibius sp. Alg239-R121 TaxID=2993448 RepID=UPI0024A71535|nr:3-methyl-2-oxobutanoate hydroxymethyltransferase [Pelagibius sp. Alg239-R121]
MSAQKPVKAATIQQIRASKNQTPIVALTAYSTPIARLLDPYVDLLLVGDSLGMVIYGMETTLGVTLEMMCAHGKAVKRGASSACVVVDMPFGSYQEAPEQAYRNAAKILAETGCAAVKLEGGREMAPTIAFLAQRGVPVMGHVGLLPQSFNSQGGFRTQGRTSEEAKRIKSDARAVAEAGAFSIVVEGVVELLAAEITETVAVPTIGIGASSRCDGQILVTEDLLGLFSEFTPKFVKRYADLAPDVSSAVAAYAQDVRSRRFPGAEHCFGTPREQPLKKGSAGESDVA